MNNSIFASIDSTANDAHLSKRLSDLKQNGTQEKKPFSGSVFHAFSQGMFRFVAIVSSKNHWVEVSDWLTKNFNKIEGGLWS